MPVPGRKRPIFSSVESAQKAMSRSSMPTALTKVAALALPPYIQTERPVARKRSSSARVSIRQRSSVTGRRSRSASERIAFSRAIVAATIERTGRVPGQRAEEHHRAAVDVGRHQVDELEPVLGEQPLHAARGVVVHVLVVDLADLAVQDGVEPVGVLHHEDPARGERQPRAGRPARAGRRCARRSAGRRRPGRGRARRPSPSPPRGRSSRRPSARRGRSPSRRSPSPGRCRAPGRPGSGRT